MDIRPENIIFENEWHIRLIDFGSASKIDPDKDAKKVYHQY